MRVCGRGECVWGAGVCEEIGEGVRGVVKV